MKWLTLFLEQLENLRKSLINVFQFYIVSQFLTDPFLLIKVVLVGLYEIKCLNVIHYTTFNVQYNTIRQQVFLKWPQPLRSSRFKKMQIIIIYKKSDGDRSKSLKSLKTINI